MVDCGRAGANLVRILEQLGHEVSVLDADPAELERLDGFEGYEFSGEAHAGIPIDTDVLRRAGIETCDAAVVSTNDDSVNIMVAQIAREVFGVERVVARITDPTLKDFFVKQYGIQPCAPPIYRCKACCWAFCRTRKAEPLPWALPLLPFYRTGC